MSRGVVKFTLHLIAFMQYLDSDITNRENTYKRSYRVEGRLIPQLLVNTRTLDRKPENIQLEVR